KIEIGLCIIRTKFNGPLKFLGGSLRLVLLIKNLAQKIMGISCSGGSSLYRDGTPKMVGCPQEFLALGQHQRKINVRFCKSWIKFDRLFKGLARCVRLAETT